MFDAALASNNPAVKKALRNFMMVTALVHSQEDNDEEVVGPFETVLKQMDDLQRRISRVESEKYTTTRTYPANPYDNTWIYNDPYPSVTSATSSDTDWKFTSTNIDDYSVDIEKYLTDALSKKGTE